MSDELVLYSYWRSSAAYRVRIALNLKELDYTIRGVHLVSDGGQQHAPDYANLNPQELVPTLVHGERVYHQSLAIIEYLDEQYAGHGVALLPNGIRERARVRALALAIACDIHPLANLRVLQFLQREWRVDDNQRDTWVRHWIAGGFDAIETMLTVHPETGDFCQGDAPGMADTCLVPQVYNAVRWGVSMDRYPVISRIHANCMELDAVQRASPKQQPDAPQSRE